MELGKKGGGGWLLRMLAWASRVQVVLRASKLRYAPNMRAIIKLEWMREWGVRIR